jgi:hypothetical protein
MTRTEVGALLSPAVDSLKKASDSIKLHVVSSFPEVKEYERLREAMGCLSAMEDSLKTVFTILSEEEGQVEDPLHYKNLETVILKVLESSGGTMARPKVHEAIWSKYSDYITPEHHALFKDRKTKRLDSLIDFARNSLKDKGLIETVSNSAIGVWKISSAGRRWLRENEGN